MKPFLFPVVLAAAVLAGCMDMETRVIVNPDGSGLVHEKFMVKNEMAEQMKKSMGGAETPDADKKMYKLEELKQKAVEYGEGVAFVSVSDTAIATHKGYLAVYSFTDVTKLKINQSLKGKAGSGAKPEDAEYLVFQFVKGKEPNLTVIMPEKKPGNEKKDLAEQKPPVDDAAMEKQMKMMKAMFDGMRFALLVQVNGNIIKSNATHVKDGTVTLFDIEFGKLLENTEKLKELSGKKPASMQETKAMLQGIPGLVIEPEGKVTVLFKGK